MRFNPHFGSRLLAIWLAAFLLVASAAVPLSASAHFLHYNSQRWAWTDGSQALLNLYYERNCASDWWTPDSAANAWTATPTPLFYHYATAPDCGGPHQGRIQVLNGNSGTGLAWTQNYTRDCVWFICWWDLNFTDRIDASMVFENHQNNAYDNLKANERLDVIKHEFGHSVGLAHAGYYGGDSPLPGPGYPWGVYSIMDYCCPSDYTGWPYFVPTTPSAHDINDIKTLYPSRYW